MFAGLLILVLGVLFLLRNFGLIHGDLFRIGWPVVIIVAGLSLLLKRSTED